MNESTSGAAADAAPGERPGDALDGEAGEAWQAYNAMETTKRRHFSLLRRLDLKKRNYGLEPSVEEARLLEWLLADHDTQVRRFTAASLALKALDARSHAALFDYVGTIARSGVGDTGAEDGAPGGGTADDPRSTH